jgi:hypothetical protein
MQNNPENTHDPDWIEIPVPEDECLPLDEDEPELDPPQEAIWDEEASESTKLRDAFP